MFVVDEKLGKFMKGIAENEWLPVKLRVAELVSAIVTLYVNAQITYDTFLKFDAAFDYNTADRHNVIFDEDDEYAGNNGELCFDLLFNAAIKLIFCDEKIKRNHLKSAKELFEYLDMFSVKRYLKRCAKEITSNILGDMVCPDGKTLYYIDLIDDSNNNVVPVVRKIEINTNSGNWRRDEGAIMFHNVERVFWDEISDILLFQLKYTNIYLRYFWREERVEAITDRILHGVKNGMEYSESWTEEVAKEIRNNTFDIDGIMNGYIGVFWYTKRGLEKELQTMFTGNGKYTVNTEVLHPDFEKNDDKGEVYFNFRKNEFGVRCVPGMTMEQCSKIMKVFCLPKTATTFYYQENIHMKILGKDT